MTGKIDTVSVPNLPSHLSQPSRRAKKKPDKVSTNFVPISANRQRRFSLRIIAILEQNQRRTRKISSHTAPCPRCQPCRRLRAGLWPPRVKVGYGYHLAHFGACWGDFQRAESKAGERGGVVDAPTPVTSAHSAGSCGRSVTGVAGRLFSAGGGGKNRKSPAVAGKTAGSQLYFREEDANDK